VVARHSMIMATEGRRFYPGFAVFAAATACTQRGPAIRRS